MVVGAGQKQKVKGAPLRRVCRVAASHVPTSLELTARTHMWAACSLGGGVACDFAVPVCSTAKAPTSKPPNLQSIQRRDSLQAEHTSSATPACICDLIPLTRNWQHRLLLLLVSRDCNCRWPSLDPSRLSTFIQGIVKDKGGLHHDSGNSTPSCHSRPWPQRERPRPWRRRSPMSPLTRPTSSCSSASAAATRSAAHVTSSSTRGKPSWCVSSNLHDPPNSLTPANSSASSTPASTPPTTDWPPSLSLTTSTSAPSTCSSSASKLHFPVPSESKLSRNGLGKARGKRGRGTGCPSTRSRRFTAPEPLPVYRP